MTKIGSGTSELDVPLLAKAIRFSTLCRSFWVFSFGNIPIRLEVSLPNPSGELRTAMPAGTPLNFNVRANAQCH